MSWRSACRTSESAPPWAGMAAIVGGHRQRIGAEKADVAVVDYVAGGRERDVDLRHRAGNPTAKRVDETGSGYAMGTRRIAPMRLCPAPLSRTAADPEKLTGATSGKRRGLWRAPKEPARLLMWPPWSPALLSKQSATYSSTEHREAKGLSAVAMARKLGIERGSVYRHEREPERVNPKKQVQWAAALGIEPEALWRPPECRPQTS